MKLRVDPYDKQLLLSILNGMFEYACEHEGANQKLQQYWVNAIAQVEAMHDRDAEIKQLVNAKLQVISDPADQIEPYSRPTLQEEP